MDPKFLNITERGELPRYVNRSSIQSIIVERDRNTTGTHLKLVLDDGQEFIVWSPETVQSITSYARENQ